MAFPSTINTSFDPYEHGFGGPFLSSTENVYALFVGGGSGNELQMMKAADPSSSWAASGSNPTVTSGNPIWRIDAYQVGDNIHVVSKDANSTSSNVLRYHVFNMSSDSWTTTNELVRTTFTTASEVYESHVKIIIRGDGTKIILYEGPQVLADIQRRRTYYARYMGAAWSADIALDNGGNTHWSPDNAVLGAADRVHFFLSDGSNFYQRCLTSANALQSFPTTFDAALGFGDIQRSVAYSASAGGTVVMHIYHNDYTELGVVRFSSSDAPVVANMTITNNIDGIFNPKDSNLRFVTSLANDGNTVYNVFASSAQDLYVQSCQDAGSWSVPTQLLVASATEVWTNIYTRNNIKVLGVIFHEFVTSPTHSTKYTEYTLSSLASTAPLHLGMLMGISR